MTPERYQRLHELFVEVCEHDPARRTEELDRACAGDPELRHELEAMLAKDDDRTCLDRPVLGDDFDLGAEFAAATPDAPLVGRRISHFYLERIIASGGMGTVYEARQDEPRRTLAVKVMHRGIASRSTLRHFEYEAQILAYLHHPNIAHVYEAGRCEDCGGVPYFAMELIADAKPITQYAGEHDLDTRGRLELFTRVCDAVHYGHQRSVIHRDLKPSNILVDGQGIPKVIDFGVARATDSDLAITTLRTDLRQLVGTLQYMSPEQCEGHAHNLDTRSDVYSLGVVLYELLCDRTPYDVSDLTVPDAIRVVREQAPARPSTINRMLRGDLETITLKAIDKDRTRRYESAAELAADLRRFVNNEPVIARPPSVRYQLRKFSRRHRGLTAGVVAFIALLVIAASVSTVLSLEAVRQREEARKQASIAEAVMEFLRGGLLEQASPYDLGPATTIREILDAASERIAGQFADEPHIEVKIRSTLGVTYSKLGLLREAEPHQTRAYGLAREHLGDDHPDTLNCLNNLAMLYKNQGRFDEAEPLYVRAVDMRKRVLGAEHPHTLGSMNGLAGLYAQRGRYDEAEVLFARLLDLQRRADGEENMDVMHNLAVVYWHLGRPDEAEPLALRTLEVRKRRANETDVANSLELLSVVYWAQGRFDELEPLYREALEIRRRILGPEHPATLSSMNNLADLYRDQGRYGEARPLFRRTLAAQTRILGEAHYSTLSTMSNFAELLHLEGRPEDAAAMFDRALAGARSTLGERHDMTGQILGNYGRLLIDLDRYEEAEASLTEAHAIIAEAVGAEHIDAVRQVDSLVHLYDRWGKPSKAAEWRAERPDGVDTAEETADGG